MTTRKLTLDCSDVTLEGEGDALTWKVRGGRTLKSGRYELIELTLKCCRWSAKQALGEIRKMHRRDRERLKREGERIEREVKELTQEQA